MSLNDVDGAIDCIRNADSILAIIGAGLSAPSAIPTFRHEGAHWRGGPMDEMSKPAVFDRDPIGVCTFYENRRQMARVVQPNAGHYALAALAQAKPNFLAVTQNVDELSERADHNPRQPVALHGSVYNVHCSRDECAVTARNYTSHPTVPGLVLPAYDVADPRIPLPQVTRSAIPLCALCKQDIVRPGVTFFEESLPAQELQRVDDWLEVNDEVDLVMIIGTSRAPFVGDAVQRGARMVVFNMGADAARSEDDDMIVEGDASKTLPYVISRALGTAM
ncbi:NAD-dependent protein deacylase [Fulvia fulva]|uniref:NAD-dependent protein deacylase n=1 Tax=Passalora fulva TaxID=5499 RepID=A0A9Q8US31_PASFU|nr:NAD-dependent protein deacylase [Fulvia fulva]UJO20336.1 NAD-dependent protein deacylase [Fulvia fulva]